MLRGPLRQIAITAGNLRRTCVCSFRNMRCLLAKAMVIMDCCGVDVCWDVFMHCSETVAK